MQDDGYFPTRLLISARALFLSGRYSPGHGRHGGRASPRLTPPGRGSGSAARRQGGHLQELRRAEHRCSGHGLRVRVLRIAHQFLNVNDRPPLKKRRAVIQF